MQKTTFLFALVFPAIAMAADVPRCGTDQFGNIVCLDKDGVLSTMPGEAAGAGKGDSASGVPAAEPGSDRAGTDARARCGTDPFGNKVCRP